MHTIQWPLRWEKVLPYYAGPTTNGLVSLNTRNTLLRVRPSYSASASLLSHRTQLRHIYQQAINAQSNVHVHMHAYSGAPLTRLNVFPGVTQSSWPPTCDGCTPIPEQLPHQQNSGRPSHPIHVMSLHCVCAVVRWCGGAVVRWCVCDSQHVLVYAKQKVAQQFVGV